MRSQCEGQGHTSVTKYTHSRVVRLRLKYSLVDRTVQWYEIVDELVHLKAVHRAARRTGT